jgi:hypothetical protein
MKVIMSRQMLNHKLNLHTTKDEHNTSSSFIRIVGETVGGKLVISLAIASFILRR